MGSKYYLALDQALKISGFAVYYISRLESCGTIETNPTHPIEDRLNTIWQHLDILDNKYNFDHVFFEDTQKQVNMETYKRLCWVQGVIILWCRKHGIPFTILAPSHWRKILKDEFGISFGRKREEQKKAAQEWVKKNFKDFQDVSEDECDAICLGTAGLAELQRNRSAF